MKDNIVKINLNDIDTFKEHPFLVNNDESFMELVKSIKENGLLHPLIVRKKENDRYEMISGHRRKKALEMLGIYEAEAIVKDLNDDEATIFMIDSNLYRERILPSEKAFAYKMKMDALKHQRKKTSDPEEPKLSSSKIGTSNGDSSTNVKRYIRLTNLIPELLNLVDETVLKSNKNGLTMGIKPAVELSYLSFTEQKLVYSIIEYSLVTPSHAQSIIIRKLAKDNKLEFDTLEKLFDEKKGNQNEKISFNKSKIENVLPSDIKKRDKRYIEEYIIRAILEYNKFEQKDDDNIIIQDLVF